MAIYKGREVTIQNYIQPGVTVPDTIQVIDKDGQSYSPKVSELQFTEDEKKQLKNFHSEKFNQVNVIKGDDLKKVREDSDPKVLEERAKKQQAGQDVSIVAKNAQVDTKPAANTSVAAVPKPSNEDVAIARTNKNTSQVNTPIGRATQDQAKNQAKK